MIQYQTKQRKLNRLAYYDYAQNGCYFVTICTKDRTENFGQIIKEGMELSPIGKNVYQCWLDIPKHFPDVLLDDFVIMPNHVHGIIIIKPKNNMIAGVGNKNFCSLQKDQTIFWQTIWARSLSSVIRGFKIGVTSWCRKNGHSDFNWQKSFYDHVIRQQESLEKIRFYILENPLKWERDRNNKENLFI